MTGCLFTFVTLWARKDKYIVVTTSSEIFLLLKNIFLVIKGKYCLCDDIIKSILSTAFLQLPLEGNVLILFQSYSAAFNGQFLNNLLKISFDDAFMFLLLITVPYNGHIFHNYTIEISLI